MRGRFHGGSKLCRSLLVLVLAAIALPAGSQTAPGLYERLPACAECLRRGNALAQRGDDKGALVEWEKARELSHDYRLLIPIGQAHQRLHQDDLAMKAYQQFIQEAPPDEPDRKRVVQMVMQLLAAQPETPPSEEKEAPPPPCPRSPKNRRQIAGRVLVGLGTIGLIPAIGLASVDGQLTGDRNCSASGDLGPYIVPCRWNLSPLYGTGFAIAGLTLGAGITLLALPEKRTKTTSTGAAPCVQPAH